MDTLKQRADALLESVRQCRDGGVGPETASMNLEELVRIVQAHLYEHEHAEQLAWEESMGPDL